MADYSADYQAERAEAEAKEALRITRGLETGDLFPVEWSDLLTCVDGLRESLAHVDLTPDDEDAMYRAMSGASFKAITLGRLLTALMNAASPHSRERHEAAMNAHRAMDTARTNTDAA